MDEGPNEGQKDGRTLHGRRHRGIQTNEQGRTRRKPQLRRRSGKRPRTHAKPRRDACRLLRLLSITQRHVPATDWVAKRVFHRGTRRPTHSVRRRTHQSRDPRRPRRARRRPFLVPHLLRRQRPRSPRSKAGGGRGGGRSKGGRIRAENERCRHAHIGCGFQITHGGEVGEQDERRRPRIRRGAHGTQFHTQIRSQNTLRNHPPHQPSLHNPSLPLNIHPPALQHATNSPPLQHPPQRLCKPTPARPSILLPSSIPIGDVHTQRDGVQGPKHHSNLRIAARNRHRAAHKTPHHAPPHPPLLLPPR
jgi:hypothetical protein